jgi:predicted aspartyl protease
MQSGAFRYNTREPGMTVLACIVLALSASAALADDSVNQPGILEVPFRFDHNEILVQARIANQEPFTALLDTGTSPSAVDVTFAKSAGLALRKVTGEVTGGGSERPEIYVTKLPSLAVNPLSARDLQAVALDLSKLRQGLSTEIQAVLGSDFLAGRILQIDYPKNVIRVYPSSFLSLSDTHGSNRVILPFKIEDDDLVLEDVAVNGKKIKAALDTGSDGSFKLTPAAIEDLRLTAVASKGETDVSVGYKGAAQNTKGTVDRITIGSIEVKSPAVIFFGKGTGRDKRPWGLNIGNQFLRDYVVTIDYPRKLIALERPER